MVKSFIKKNNNFNNISRYGINNEKNDTKITNKIIINKSMPNSPRSSVRNNLKIKENPDINNGTIVKNSTKVVNKTTNNTRKNSPRTLRNNFQAASKSSLNVKMAFDEIKVNSKKGDFITKENNNSSKVGNSNKIIKPALAAKGNVNSSRFKVNKIK